MSEKEIFPPRPHAPTCAQVLEDLENATVDDAVFEDLPKKFTEDPRLDAESFTAAQDFMVSIKKIELLRSQLSELKEELEKKLEGLEFMVKEIKSQAIDV